MSHQVGLTVSGRVVPERLADLERIVASMAADPAGNAVIPFAGLPHTHFARVVLLPAGAGGNDAPTLLMTLDCDAPATDRLRALVTVAAAGMD